MSTETTLSIQKDETNPVMCGSVVRRCGPVTNLALLLEHMSEVRSH